MFGLIFINSIYANCAYLTAKRQKEMVFVYKYSVKLMEIAIPRNAIEIQAAKLKRWHN